MTLVAVEWDDLALNVLNDAGLTAVVTEVDGWYGTPDAETNDVNRALTDGSLYGPKVIAAREITVKGTALGPRDQLIALRDALATRTVATAPGEVVIGDPWLNTELAATVRASSGLSHAFLNPNTFTYEVTLLAADPRRYIHAWSEAVIRLSGGGTSGRHYPRTYQWQYGSTEVAGTARLTNVGNVAAPVYAVYTGPLSESRLTDSNRQIRIAALADGEQIMIDTDSLVAQAPGGATRASFVLAGSAPLLVPPRTTVTWNLLATGTGTVHLYWRGAFA